MDGWENTFKSTLQSFIFYRLTLRLQKLVVILLASWSLFAHAKVTDYSEVGLPVMEQFNSEQTKGINQNWTLANYSDGLIVNGTGTGISIWDGENWQFIRTPNRTLVSALSVWQDGNIYIGTNDDIGFYASLENGELMFQSLVTEWPLMERQFGEVASIATNESYVLFVTDSAFIAWDGDQLRRIARDEKGQTRVFSINNEFFFKRFDDDYLSKLVITDNSMSIVQSAWRAPPSAQLSHLLINQDKDLVAFTEKSGIFALSKVNKSQQIVSSNDLLNSRVYTAMQASDGIYYVLTLEHGLFILNQALEPVRQYTKEHGLGGNRLYGVTEDRQGMIWLAGVPNVIKMTPPHKHSRFYTDSQLANKLTLFQGHLTIGGYGIFQFTESDKPLAPAYFQSRLESKQLLWDFITYKEHLIYTGRAGIIALKINTNGSLGDPFSLVDKAVGKTVIFDNTNDLLYASTMDGLYTIKAIENEFTVQKLALNAPSIIYSTLDKQGTFWGGTASQELYKIKNPSEIVDSSQMESFGANEGIGPNNVVTFLSSKGLIIGTNDGFLTYNESRKTPFKIIESHSQIFSTKGQDVFKLWEDRFNRLWYRVGTHTGYVDYSSSSPFVANETIFAPLKDKGYKGFYSDSKDVLWFISANGEINRINITSSEEVPAISPINIRSVIDIDSSGVKYGGAGELQLPILEQSQNSLRFTFALADNVNMNASQYRHRLLGSTDEQWSGWSYSNQKEFTQLPGSDYVFEVQAKDAYEQISSRAIKFTVLPPWHLSSQAFALYIVLLFIVISFIAWLSQKWRTQVLTKRNETLQLLVEEKTAEIADKAKQLEREQALKDQFFANVSHEFRTPITLTLLPLIDILNSKENISDKVKSSVKTALRNSKKTLDLIGQVLDIQKLDNDSLQLRVAQYDIVAMLDDVVKRFEMWAKQQQQTLTLSHSAKPLLVYFDLELLDRCVSNLLSNAIKYSGEGSNIDVSVNLTENEYLNISVFDNGQGVQKEDQNRIFERYYQGKLSKQLHQPGTGIGLAMVKEVIEAHQGSVKYRPNQPSGSCFSIKLKLGRPNFQNAVFVDEVTQNNILQQHLSNKELEANTADLKFLNPVNTVDLMNESGVDKTTLLIVDDNPELQAFIAQSLAHSYHILLANNGRKGFELATSLLPDLIISDLMMPVMDGLEMMSHLKSDKRTYAMPVILLTAKSTKRETVEGLMAGADDYLGKPFDTSELIARVDSIIRNRKAVRQAVRSEILGAQSNAQSSFSRKVIDTIHSNMSQPSFGAEKLASNMAMSQRKLLRRCKEEFSMSIVQLISKQRLEKAKSLLYDSHYNVSEIAYACGYESLSYFSKVYKKHFGYPPSKDKT